MPLPRCEWLIAKISEFPTRFVRYTSMSLHLPQHQACMHHFWICPTDPQENPVDVLGNHAFIHAFIHSFIHSFIRSFVHSFIRSFVHSFMHSCINAFMHSCIHAFMHSFIHSFNQSIIHSFIHSFIHLFIHSFIHSFIHWSCCLWIQVTFAVEIFFGVVFYLGNCHCKRQSM